MNVGYVQKDVTNVNFLQFQQSAMVAEKEWFWWIMLVKNVKEVVYNVQWMTNQFVWKLLMVFMLTNQVLQKDALKYVRHVTTTESVFNIRRVK